MLRLGSICSSKTSATDHSDTLPSRESEGIGMPPLVFSHPPRKSKFLDLSPSKTRVIADIGGDLPQSRVTLSSLTAANSDFSDDYGSDPHYALPQYESHSGDVVEKSLPASEDTMV